ncbi:MAG: PQQ-binding-like beta-propeller repeat protein [Phycisphaerales bacterium]|nr:MAG: PQQ-binding-like beta-propeller repeat protein [Phycisphaerales bacterium]
MKTLVGLMSIFLCCCAAVADDAVPELSSHLGKTPALVVVVCRGDEQDLPTIARLVEQTPWMVFCRGTTSPGMDKIRDWVSTKGLLGKRVYVVDDNSASLWLAGDLADAVWVAPGVDYQRFEKEILRVLHPGGVCIASGRVVTKPAQADVDEWRHPYHEPDNNVVSRDSVSRLPGELRFQTYPVFAAMPNQTLFAGGRIFFFSGHIAFHEREEPLLNTLTVLNAYNGLRLWSRPLNPDYVVHNISKLATGTEVVFAEGGTLWMLDAATGQERGRFSVPTEAAAAGDTDFKWIVQEDGTLWVAFGPPDAHVAPHKQKRQMGHWPWDVANEQYRSITNNFGAARTLAAFRYPQMKLLWSISEPEPFDARALCIEGSRIFILAPGRYVAARDCATGDQLWRQTPETSGALFNAIGDSLKRQGWGLGWATYCCARAKDGVVCIAGPSFKKTIAIGLDKGDLLWSSDIPSGHPFFFDGALYIVPRVANPAAFCRKVDPRTGKVIDEFSLGVIGSCTRLTVTPNQFFYRPGGGEGRTVYVDIAARKLSDYEGIVRPGCFDGVVPANGRLYWMPLACDCWQVHGTFSMAPRSRPRASIMPTKASWASPASSAPAARDDWPMFRANAAATATVPTSVGKGARRLWHRRLPGGGLTAPVCANGRVFVGATDGTVRALDASTGEILWQTSSNAAVLGPPAYWNGRIIFGSCDGILYCVDASDGRLLGRAELAPEKRFVNIMDRFMSAWPLGGGVVLDADGIAYTAAGSTAADGTVAAAVDVATGRFRWHQAYTLDRSEPKLSFGVQGNILLKYNTLYINGGAPVGIVALDAATGANPQVVSRLEAGMEMFLEPDNKPSCTGPELFSHEQARTTIFKRHQGRVYFQMSDRHVALIDGRLFCSRDQRVLDRIVDKMNTDPRTGGKMGGSTVPWDVMRIPLDDSIRVAGLQPAIQGPDPALARGQAPPEKAGALDTHLWAGDTADVRGLAVGSDGLVALHQDSVEGVSADGQSLWSVPLAAPPVRWGLALTGNECVVTITGGQVVCLTKRLSAD